MKNIDRIAILPTTTAIAWIILFFIPRNSVHAAAETKHPNLLVLLADDLRADTVGFAGHPIVKTPHLDALSERGVRFRNHFVTTAICAVSRASIFSGQYARRQHINDFKTSFTAEAWAQCYPALPGTW